MKSAIALLSVLALTVYVAAAMNVPWRPLPTAERQRMSYRHGHEPNRRMDNKPANEQSIQGYGPGEQNTEREIGESALLNHCYLVRSRTMKNDYSVTL